MLQDSPGFRSLLLALAFSAFYAALEAQAPTVTLTITNNGVVSGAVGVQGPNGNVCNPNAGGGAGSGTCVFTYPVNTPLRIAANSPNPDAGFLHSGSGDTATCANSTCNIVLTTDSSITATFDASQGPVASIQTTLLGDGTGNVSTDNGQCQNFELGYTDCTTYYAVGSEVKFVGRSMPGNIFERFSGGAGDTTVCGANSTCTFTATGNSSVNATFSALASVAITPSAATVAVGNNQFFSARATFTNGMTRFGFNGNTPWQNHTPMDVERFSLAAAVVGDRLYAIGGVDGFCPPDGSPCPFSPLSTVEIFNPLVTAYAEFERAWMPRRSMATPRGGLAAVAVDDRIYAIGGYTLDGDAVASIEAYDPVANTWSARAAMSGARAGMAAAVVNRTIYVVGGSIPSAGGPATALATVEAYDVLTNTWTTKMPMPTARSTPAAAAVNGTLYVIGGDGTGSVEAYDPIADSWSARASMPSGGGAHRAVALNGLIYAVGGSPISVKVYNPALDSWAALVSSMPPPVNGQFALAVLDGRLFAAGGNLADNTAVGTVSANRPPEATWWSNNSAVGRINSGNSGSVRGDSIGTATISARLVGVDSGAQSALLTVSAGGGGGSTIFVSGPNQAFTEVGQSNWGCGTFNQSAPGPWTVTVNYGDGGGVEPMPFTPNPPAGTCSSPGSFSKGVFYFNHAYSSPGTFPVVVTVRNTATNATGTKAFHVLVAAAEPEDCAPVVSNISVIGTVPFNRVQVAVFDRPTNTRLFDGELPLGWFDDAALPAGPYRIEFAVPPGYMVTPSSFSIDAVCGQTIHLNATVQAVPPPTISVSLSPNTIWPPNNKMVTITATLTASSPNGHATAVTLLHVSNNETGSGDVEEASIGSDDRSFAVRAKRHSGGGDRIYTVTYRATDAVTGFSTTASATVVVPHDQGRK